MIRLADSSDVGKFLHRVLETPELFKRVLICSPYIDDSWCRVVASLVSVTAGNQCGCRIITRGTEIKRILGHLTGRSRDWLNVIVPVERIHAKAYLAIGRSGKDTCAIVTSANLTDGGVSNNVELGIIASPVSDEGRRIVTDVRIFLDQLVDYRRQSIYNPWRAA